MGETAKVEKYPEYKDEGDYWPQYDVNDQRNVFQINKIQNTKFT